MFWKTNNWHFLIYNIYLFRLEEHHQRKQDSPFTPSSSEPLTQVTRKLKSQGMTVAIEKKLVRFKEIILRLNSIKIK